MLLAYAELENQPPARVPNWSLRDITVEGYPTVDIYSVCSGSYRRELERRTGDRDKL